MRGADLVARSLARAGARKVFSLSGNHIMVLYDAALDAGLDIVHVRHEGAAVHMADAWGRIAGEPGIALLTGGPGHANGVGALYNALAAESPLVLLSGHAPLAQLGTDAFQEMRQAEVAAPLCKASWTAQRATDLGDEIAHAIRIATTGRPGPVHLSLPTDLLESQVADGARRVPEAIAYRPERRGLDDSAVRAVLHALAQALRPVIVAAPSFANGRGRTLREAIAAATGIPVLFTESPRGTADPALGALADLLPQADLVVLLGRKLDFSLRFGRPPAFGAQCRFIHIDPDAESLRRAMAAIGDSTRLVASAQADPLPAAEALLAQAQRGFPAAAGLAEWSDAVREALAYRPAEWRNAASSPGAVHPAAVGSAVARALASRAEAVLVGDGGEFGQWAMACASAATRITNGPGGGIGCSIPYAVAARLARPDATVVATLGDGAFGFHLAEFETAARCGAPFVAMLGNDARWNAERQIQLRHYGEARARGCELLPARYDLAVQALGGHGERVTRAEELDGAIGRAIASGKPACIDVSIAPLAAPMLSRTALPPGGAH